MKYWRGIMTSVLLVAAIAMAATAYQEAPMFAKLVAAGKLPPVEERLPEHPRVVTPLDRIGVYGGQANVYTNSQFWLWSGEIVGFDWLLTIDANYDWGIPNILESYEFNEDATAVTLHLRKGLKYSDGVEFTTEDFLFNWEYVYQNTDLFAEIPYFMVVNGEPLVMTAIDDYTLLIEFAAPNALFLNLLSGAGATQTWRWWYGLFMPAHYCKQFHPAFVGQDVVDAAAAEAGLASWVDYFWTKVGGYFGIQEQPYTMISPVLGAYVCVERTPERAVWERNAYYWKVDTAGNQLPYIDRVVLHFVESTDVIDGKIISGEVDAEWILGSLDALPVYIDNQGLGGYEVRLYDTPGMAAMELNLTHPDPVIREIFNDLRFRQALSLALNRDEMNEATALGLATPRSVCVPRGSPYYVEGGDTSYIEYDPTAAEALLDAMGLEKKDRDGFRLRSDGERLRLTIEAAEVDPGLELIREYWRAVGFDVDVKAQTQDLLNERVAANLVDIMPVVIEFNIEPDFSMLPQFYVPLTYTWPGLWANQWGLYNVTGGTQGEKPPAKIQQLIDWYNEIMTAQTIEDRIGPAQNIMASHRDNLWLIGTLGGAPVPVIVKNDLMNVPETGLMTWDLSRMVPYEPCTWFFDTRPAYPNPWPGRFED